MRRAPLNLETQTGRRAVLAAAAGLALFGAAILYHFFSATPTIVRVGYSALPPYVVVDANGKPAGLAVEMIRRAASRAEIPIRWVSIPKTPDEAIEKNLIDLYPLLTITDKRKARFHLTESWWENESALISPEKAAIVNAAGTAGKRVATRHGAVRAQARRLFPRAKLIANPDIDDVEKAMCAGRLDAFFIDLRVLQSQLLKRVPACSGQALHVAFIPEGSVALATASSRASAGVAERLYREIAQLSLDGTLSELASRAGIFSPYQTGHMKDAINAAHRAETLRWGLLAVTAILVLTTIQTRRIRRAGMVAESARREADESRQRFDAFMQHTPAIAFIKDEDGRMVYCNDAYGKTFRTSLAEIEGKLDHELWPEEIAKELRRNDRTVLEGDRGIELAETVRDPSGELRHFLALKFPFRNRLGQKYLGGVALDITERKRAEQALRFSQFSIDRSPDTILWIDSDSKIFYANEAACRQLEYKREELLELSVRDIEPSFTWERFSGSHRELKEKGSMTLESHHRTRAGRTIPVEVSLNYLEFDGREFSCWMSRDITERKRAEGELSYQAKHDLLTGLPNRRLFENRLEQSIRDAERDNAMAAVFYLDLDGFKLVNDTLGHVAGDALLKQVAQRFKSCIRQGDTLARVGGDEFTLVAGNLAGEEDAVVIALKLLSKVQEPYEILGHEVRITGSAGISLFPRDNPDGNGLLQSADAAMYESKRRGKNQVQFFTREMGEAARERTKLEQHLPRALDRGEFQLHYQPQVCLLTGEITRFEALIRWNHPTMGAIPPSKFIGLAEDTGLIVSIGNWVLEEACRQAREWRDAGLSNAGVGVNVSVVQFARPDFVDNVIAALDRTGLPASLLELELTETVVMGRLIEVAEKIALLRSLGVSVSIDDFGTGYSSLSYLQKLQVDVLKIDRSFVRDIATDGNAASLTKALISLAHSLDIQVVIEGIETQPQLNIVRRLGCDTVQGYLLGRPVPASEALGMAVEQLAPEPQLACA